MHSPECFSLKLLLIACTANVEISKREVGYYVLNSLDVLQGKANPYEVLEAITQDQKAGFERTIFVPGKESSYNWQHINEQMNYLELANLIRFTDDKRVVLNPNEMPTIELFAADWDKKPEFDVYSYDLSTVEKRKKFQYDWDAYFARISPCASRVCYIRCLLVVDAKNLKRRMQRQLKLILPNSVMRVSKSYMNMRKSELPRSIRD